MSEETRSRILEAGAELIHQRGFNNTGLKDILKAADVPKGSFYFYFDNKEAFGIELVDFMRQRFAEIVLPLVADTSISPLERLHAFFDFFIAHFASQGFTRGCPFGNLAQEMSDLSEPFRAKLEEALNGLAKTFTTLLVEAEECGEIPADLNLEETAIFMVQAWHGAIIRMKVTKEASPLILCKKTIFERLLK